jgi:hypothetical protein
MCWMHGLKACNRCLKGRRTYVDMRMTVRHEGEGHEPVSNGKIRAGVSNRKDEDYPIWAVLGTKGKQLRVSRILFKWLNRRSQRRSFTWEEFEGCWERYRAMKPRITERYYQLKLNLSY